MGNLAFNLAAVSGHAIILNSYNQKMCFKAFYGTCKLEF